MLTAVVYPQKPSGYMDPKDPCNRSDKRNGGDFRRFERYACTPYLLGPHGQQQQQPALRFWASIVAAAATCTRPPLLVLRQSFAQAAV
jgi:hypothetical protein